MTGCGDDDDDDCGAGACTDAGPDGDADGDGDGGVVIDSAEALYASENLVEIELTLSAESMEALDESPREYQPGTLRVGDEVLEDVGVRLKGMASYRDLEGKASFKIKMDEFVDGQRLFGLRRLTLNNLMHDPSGTHERLGYRFMRAAGVVAPRCNSVRLTVNGEYWGLYANVESLDDEFVETSFGDVVGNLYDTDYFVDLIPGAELGYQLETNRDVADRSDLAALIEAVNDPVGSFTDNVDPLLDLDAVLRLGATQAILADWDGYFGARNNYKLYHDAVSGRFVILPWGIDQTFGFSGAPYYRGTEYDIYGTDSDRYNGWLFLRCKAEPACLARYQAAVADALEVWSSLPLEEELEAMIAQIQGSVEDDPRRESTMTDFDSEYRRVRAFIRGRAAAVQAQLDAALPELCENDVDDDGDGDVDCGDADCVPLVVDTVQALCTGQDDSCAGASPPDDVPAAITVSGWVVVPAVGFHGISGATVELVSNADGEVLASDTTGQYGAFEVDVDTGGAPVDAAVVARLDGALVCRVTLPPLTRTTSTGIAILYEPAVLDALAADAGIVRDPDLGVVVLRAQDCADVAIFYPEFTVDPEPPAWDALAFFGGTVLLNVPPGELTVSGAFEGRSFGPATVTAVGGQVSVLPLYPGVP